MQATIDGDQYICTVLERGLACTCALRAVAHRTLRPWVDRTTIGPMRFGLFLPAFAEFADPGRVAELAATAEQCGWDGFFLWDHLLGPEGMGVADPWVTLAAVAMATERIRIGALVTPLSRRRPWVMARQVATLDRLSDGRVVVGVGLGGDAWRELSAFGELVDTADRRRMYDESLDVLKRLLNGTAVHHQGELLTVDTGPFAPLPVQDPVPMWAACEWPSRRPLVRAARLQGCFPIFRARFPRGLGRFRTRPGRPQNRPLTPTPTEVGEVRDELDRLGAPPDIDLVVRCALSVDERGPLQARLSDLDRAGVTWVLESFGPGEPPAAVVEQVVRRGPPP